MKQLIHLDIKGMHCPDCPQKIENSLLKMNGVFKVNINYEAESGSVTINKNLVTINEIINEISNVGFDAKVTV